MPKPTKQRIQKAEHACREIVTIMRRHREFDDHRSEHDQSTYTGHNGSTIVAADIRFIKDGREILHTPEGLLGEDYDNPNLVGGRVLLQAARAAAKQATLRLNDTTRVYICTSEKGWVEVGYEFLNQPAERGGQPR